MKSEQRAYYIWNELIKVAKRQELITYSDLAKNIGCHHRALYYPLGYIQDYCLAEKLPPLTMLVVNKATGLPGDGFIATDTKLFNKTRKEIYAFEWSKIEQAFAIFKDGKSIDGFVEKILKAKDIKEVYTQVKSRGVAQSLFRKALLKVYGSKCAISGITIKKCLEAAHIIPWTHADNDQKLDIRNGILLSATYHKLFDAGIISISEDYTVIVNDLDKQSNEHDKAFLESIHGRKIHLPHKIAHRPSKEYLKNKR